MTRSIIGAATGVLMGLLAGCGTTSSEVSSQTREAPLILDAGDVAAAIASAPRFKLFGFSAHNLSTVPEEHQQWAKASMAIGERLMIISVEQNSLASQAGLQRGDILVSIGGVHICKGASGVAILQNNIAAQIEWSEPVKIVVIREGGAIELSLPARSQPKSLALVSP